MNKNQKKANLNDSVWKMLFKINENVAEASKLLSTSSYSLDPQFVLSRGSAPDLAGGAYSAPPDLLASLWGPYI